MAVTGRLSFLLLVIIPLAYEARAAVLKLEAENQLNNKFLTITRLNASARKVVHLFQGERIFLEYCLKEDAHVQVKYLYFSESDGESEIGVSMDNESAGTFTTAAISDGHIPWNNIQSSSSLNVSKHQSLGRHSIEILVVHASSFGVELDAIELDIPQYNQDFGSVSCNVYCFDDILYRDDNIHYERHTQTKAKIIQKSSQTLCAEEDNVNVPVFHPSAKQFRVTAKHPKYQTFMNNREPDWRSCPMSRALWEFKNFNISYDVNMQSDTTWIIGQKRGLDVILNIEFSLEGPSTGSIDSEIGTVITLSLGGVPAYAKMPVVASLSYLDRYSHWSTSAFQRLHSNSSTLYWSIPDFTFKEGRGNKIRIETNLLTNHVPFVKELSMTRRKLNNDKSTEIYNDGVTIIEAVDIDTWWRINETMTVVLDNGDVFGNVDYFRFYQRLPWTKDGFSQVFVMYQDGNVRLLPVTPHGLDWIPFGSSVLLGQTDPHLTRPSAPISHININPKSLKMDIFYADRGTMTLQIIATPRETQLVISNAEYTRDLNVHPFFTFRSMWVEDGNADVDHVRIDGTKARGIISDWTEENGYNIWFYRKCISKHNTLSPDISLDIIE